MLSKCTTGAMASKNASSPSPVSFCTASPSAGEVRGPVAIITLSQSCGGRPATSLRSNVISASASMRRVTSCENASRSTARAPPAGSFVASPADKISEPQRRISSCSRPTALVSHSSERNEFEHTSSARPSVRCASVMRVGRISCSTTGTPAAATCQAASEPAKPPPMTWIGLMCEVCLLIGGAYHMDAAGGKGGVFNRRPKRAVLPPAVIEPSTARRGRVVNHA